MLIGGTVRAWFVFLTCEDSKKHELFEMQICHSLGAQRWFRHRTKKPVTASLLLHCIDGCCCFGYENEFCDAVFQVSDWSFLVLNSNGNVCHWIPKVIWPRMDRFWVSCSKMAPFLFLFKNGSFRLLHIFTFWNRQELLICYSFWWHRDFRRLLWGVFWSVL